MMRAEPTTPCTAETEVHCTVNAMNSALYLAQSWIQFSTPRRLF